MPYEGEGKCTPGKYDQPKCPGSNCYNPSNVAFYACCQGPTPIENPMDCSKLEVNFNLYLVNSFLLCSYVCQFLRGKDLLTFFRSLSNDVCARIPPDAVFDLAWLGVDLKIGIYLERTTISSAA